MTTVKNTRPAAEVLADVRRLRDRKYEINQQLSDVNRDLSACEIELLRIRDAAGVDRLAANGMSVSFTESLRAKYDPASWNELVKWAVETGNLQCIQRRLSDAKVADLVSCGEALPDGLSLESYVRVNYRRN